MSYKSILVHLTDDVRNDARIEAAMALNDKAHLIGLYTIIPM